MLVLKFFGPLMDIAGESLHVPADNIHKVSDLIASLSQQTQLYEAITAPQVMIALNQSIVSAEAIVNDGDEVAFLPPVTGG